MGEWRMGDQKMGDQNGVGQILDYPMLNDRVLADRNMAGPFAGGTGLDGFGLHDQPRVCPNRYHEMAVDPLKDARSEGGLAWGGSKIHVQVLRLRSATGTAWVF